MLSNSGSAASEPFGERHSLQLGALHTASRQAEEQKQHRSLLCMKTAMG